MYVVPCALRAPSPRSDDAPMNHPVRAGTATPLRMQCRFARRHRARTDLGGSERHLLTDATHQEGSFLWVEPTPHPMPLTGLEGVREALPSDGASLANALGSGLVRLVDGKEELEIRVAARGPFEIDSGDGGRCVAKVVLGGFGDVRRCHVVIRLSIQPSMPTPRRAETRITRGGHG